MRIYTPTFISLFISILLFFSACQKEIRFGNSGSVPGTIINPSPVSGNLAGKVLDENNNPVAGATVRTGSQTVSTDARGLFRFNNAQLDKYASLVTVEKIGYFKSYRVFSASSGTNYVKIKLIPRLLSGTIDAMMGGQITLPGNSRITLPAASVIVQSTGLPYTGSIKIFASVIDPTSPDIMETVPGSFQANDSNNYRVILKSFGMMAVELEGSGGEKLQLATGKKATIRFTIPVSLRATAPASIPLWSVNETTGIWKQEGSAVKTADYYEGEVSHFSFWNCDINIPTIYLDLTVATAEGPLPYTNVKITRVNNGGFSYGFTDSLGYVGGLVPKNEPLLLEIMNNCNQAIYSQNIGPYSSNTSLGTITITPSPVALLHISGSAVNCLNQPVTNGVALNYFEGKLYIGQITNGNFSFTITRCVNSSATVEIIVVDHATNQQSSPWTGSAATGTVTTGVLSACGISSESYINYTVDGTNFTINTSVPGDSITSNTNVGGVQNNTNVYGYKLSQPGTNIQFFTSAAAVGTFPLQSISVNQFSQVTLVAPFNITFTTYGNPGQFIEGNFSGQFRDAGNNLHNISATFKVRRL